MSQEIVYSQYFNYKNSGGSLSGYKHKSSCNLRGFSIVGEMNEIEVNW